MKDINPHGAAAVMIAGFFNSVGRAKAARLLACGKFMKVLENFLRIKHLFF